jgi:hypothetical protein
LQSAEELQMIRSTDDASWVVVVVVVVVIWGL